MTIRKAEISDLPTILKMSEQFWETTVFDEPFGYQKTLELVDLSMSQDMLLVLEIDGVVQGFISGIINDLMASNGAKIGTEIAYWINQDHRKSGEGIKLIEAMEKNAKAAGVKYWVMVSMESSYPEVSNKIYDKLGYKKAETTYMKVL